jgi:hypothetical protein
VRHSVYNTPYESQCSGTSTLDVVFSTPLINGGCLYETGTLNSTFKQQVDLNGSGVSNDYGALQVEALPQCKSNRPPGVVVTYRAVNVIRPACGGVLSEGTVASFAASTSGDPLQCGDEVFIYGLGAGLGTTKTVTDNCPACGPSPTYARQLDNYTTRQACNPHDFVDHGNFKTIEIF